LLIFLFFNLLIYKSITGQINPHTKLEQDSLLFDQAASELVEYEQNAKRLIDSALQAEKKKKENYYSILLLDQKIHLKYFNLLLGKLIDYNNYEGFRSGFGLATNEGVSKYFSISGYFGYGFKDKDWKYGGDLILNLQKSSESELHFSYSNDVKEKAGYFFLRKKDFTTTEIYRKYMIENMDWIEKYEASFSFLSLQYLTSYISFSKEFVTPTDNYTYGENLTTSLNTFTFNEITLQIRYAYNEKFTQTLRSKHTLGTNYPILYANIIKGVNWIDGKYEYTKYEAKITKSFITESLGKTKISLVGGVVNGKVPISKLYNGHGSYQSFSLEAENSFGTIRMGEFYSDKFFSVFFKHNFGNYFLKTELFAPEFIIVHNYGIGTLNSKENHFANNPLQSIDKGFYEGGILINNILNQSFLGYGFGVFYRYGPYSFSKIANNFSYKLSLTIRL
jgi:hypothetical protein